jgi:hypothetical protein
MDKVLLPPRMLDGLGANAYGEGGIESSNRAANDEQLSLTSVLAE